MSFEIRVDNPTTDESKIVKVTIEEFNALLNGKEVLKVYARHGSLEIHFKHIVFTVDPVHISFFEIVGKKKWDGYFSLMKK